VDVVENTTVRELAVDDDSVVLQTTAGELRARAVVVTAGPWVDRIVGAVGLVLDVTPVRETVAYFRPRVADDVPTLSEWRLEERLVNYGLLNRDGLLKVGVSGSGVPCDPDGPAEIDQSVVAQASEWAARHFALAGDVPVAAETCTYTNTPDERFIVERHGRVVIGSACSGHGFKFAPVVGEQLAALAREAAAS
jgi:glycine/D-amino acid oxidase-like deaminating enzyme